MTWIKIRSKKEEFTFKKKQLVSPRDILKVISKKKNVSRENIVFVVTWIFQNEISKLLIFTAKKGGERTRESPYTFFS